MAVQEIRVRNTDRDVKGEELLHEAKRTLGVTELEGVETEKVYWVEGDEVDEEQARILAEKLLADPVNQTFRLNPQPDQGLNFLHVGYNRGVTNPESDSIKKAAKDLGVPLTAADSSVVYFLKGQVTEDGKARIANEVRNKTVQGLIDGKPETLIIEGEVGPVKTVPVRTATDEQLMELSKDKLFLNPAEMKVVRSYFITLGRDPTDAELEIIAASWSEHCGHKTFKAKIFVDGVEKKPLYTRIQEEARKHFGNEEDPQSFRVVSAFVDNSGVASFYEGWAINGKGETHNSPSAVEPYGGAATGDGGLVRDDEETGQGARVLMTASMYCTAHPKMDLAKLPEGCLPPDYILRRVVAGVADYGNRMGIPTNNGSVHFHDDFRAKPTVLVGGYGILPENKAQKGEAAPGDLVVLVGGRTGRDGIHGATFSSGEMTDRTISVNAASVQIGNAIEEKRMFDAELEARDLGLKRGGTDLGAGGMGLAIKELGENTGVEIDLSKAPLKYTGLAPWEILIAESQERLANIVSPDKIDEFLAVCKKYNVEATVMGQFTDSKKFVVKHGDQTVVDLDYEFLNDGLPQREMVAHYEKPQFEEVVPEEPEDYVAMLKKVMAHGNVCSKEPIVRRYDHGVQGTNALPPFSGEQLDGPNDAVVITPLLDKPYGMVVSHGMNPILNRIDPYNGTTWAVAEAMANYVAVGGNPDECAWINNYIWPFPDEKWMGSLDKCVDAVIDSMSAFERPVISGKDSLSSTYRGNDGTVINIPPTLCLSVFGRIPDVEKTVTADLKRSGSTLVLVGEMSSEMGGSTYYDVNGIVGNEVPKVKLETLPKTMRGMYEAINSGEVLSCHDVSEGGVIGSITEMCFGGDMGVDLDLEEMARPDLFLFNETAGCFVAEIGDESRVEELFKYLPHKILGRTKQEKLLTVNVGLTRLFDASVDEIKQAWQAPMKELFE